MPDNPNPVGRSLNNSPLAKALEKASAFIRLPPGIAKAATPDRLASALAKAAPYCKAKPAVKDDGAVSSGDLAGGGELAPDQTSIASMPGRERTHHGIKVVIDRPAGMKQAGVGADGTPYEREYKLDYGYIPGTKGGDGDGLDVFLGPNEDSDRAYWAVQQKDDGTFDEYKLLFGFEDEAAARKAYCDHIPEKYLKGVVETSVGMVKALLGMEPSEVMNAALLEAFGGMMSKALAWPVNTATPSTARLDEKEEPPAAIGKCGITMDGSGVVMRTLEIGRTRTLKGEDPMAPVPVEEAGEERFILGIVLEPDVVDSQGDTYSSEAVEETAHDWLERFRNIDLQHKVFVNGLVSPVESYITRSDQEINGQSVKQGSWILGVHVNDDGIWAKVKSGAFTGFSINGFAKRKPAGAA